VRKGQQGTRPVRSAIVTIRTSAEVLNSDLDASALLKVVDKHDALRFTVSDLEVIQGLEFAVQLMDLGELAEVKITPKFAYGDMGE
jgi:FK506-binding protein 8